MRVVFQTYPFRFGDQILNHKYDVKKQIEDVLLDPPLDIPSLSRPHLNEILEQRFEGKGGWELQPRVFEDLADPGAKMDFLKERVGVEAQFGHASFLGIDLLKFQAASYSSEEKIDVGVYIVTTQKFQKEMEKQGQTWGGSLSFEKVKDYLPHFRSAVQVPIMVYGLDIP
jgi:Restriction endonuclease BglII